MTHHRMLSRRRMSVALVVAVLSTAARADTIFVDDDACPGPGSGTAGDPYCSIQTGIDNAATEGDEIVVAPGTYFENINTRGKAITVRSTDPDDAAVVAATIIDGGGSGTVAVISGAAQLSGLTITNGSAGNGGGLWLSGNAVATRCTVTGNTATEAGGGARAGATSTLSDCTFTGNSAPRGGGLTFPLSSSSSVTVAGCTFTDNTATGASYDQGGGGIDIEPLANPTITGCTFNGNTAVSHGGAIRIEGGNPSVTGCAFSGNTASYGGAIGLFLAGIVDVIDCTFTGNTATQQVPYLESCQLLYNGGGAIQSFITEQLTVSGCTFSGNTATVGDCQVGDQAAGGAIYCTGCNPFPLGICSPPKVDLIVSDSTFDGNAAAGLGGALFAEECVDVVVSRSTFADNSTFTCWNPALVGNGEAILLDDFQVSATLNNCAFIQNGSQGVVVGSTTATNSTFVGSGGADEGLVFVTLRNCIVREMAVSGAMSVTYSNVQGGHPGTGNIDADPLFVDPDNGDYHLGPGSPCIDAANNNASGLDGVTTDLDGNPRFMDDPATTDTGNGAPPIVDMGAYEFQAETPCPWDCQTSAGGPDGHVSINDFLDLLLQWHLLGTSCDMGLGQPGVGIEEFLALLVNWGPCP